MAKFFVGLTLPRKLDKCLSSLSLQIDPDYTKRLPLHLTLNPPFETEEDPAILSDKIFQFGPDFKDLELQLAGFGVFNRNNVHIKVRPEARLEELRNKILSLTRYQPSYENFSPHISLGDHLSKEQIELAGEILNKKNLSEVFRPKYLDLFKHSEKPGDRRWESFERYLLNDNE
jgi:2'-5' RNA ligase